MQIQLTITEEFGDVVSFAEFAQALQSFLAGRTHHVKVGKIEASQAAMSAAARKVGSALEIALPIDPSTAISVGEAYAAIGDGSPEPAPGDAAAKPKRRGRPPKSETPAGAETPVADLFAAAEPTPEPAPAPVASAAIPLSFDQVRARVLRFVELRPDQAAAAAEWSKLLKEAGYASVAEITNDRAGETAEAKAGRIAEIVGKLNAMIARAEAAAKAARFGVA